MAGLGDENAVAIGDECGWCGGREMRILGDAEGPKYKHGGDQKS